MKSYLKISIFTTMAGVLIINTSCGRSKTPTPQNNVSKLDGAEDGTYAPFDQDCSTEEKCSPLMMTIQGIDRASNNLNASSFRGETGIPLIWGAGAMVTVGKTGQDISEGIRSSNRLKFSTENLPSNASDVQSAGYGVGFTMNSQTPTSGSFLVKVRDVGRCKLLQQKSNNSAALCDDMSKNISDTTIEVKKTFPFTITENARNRQIKIQLQQLEQQCKTSTQTSLLQALPGLLSGNILNTGIQAGVGVFSSKQQCEAQRQQLLNQMNTNTDTNTNLPQQDSQ